MLYQLSYFRIAFFLLLQSAGFAFTLPRLDVLSSWGKVVLYQLSYFRIAFFAFAVCQFCFYLAKVGYFIFLGQGCALPTELLPHCFFLLLQSAGFAFTLPRL
ncbi:hypothetical protein [Tannerella forsythia]|uniref:Uncharacterized protein n=1 Tax=Tannerella forsythia TaxID=28112 RepID=A0A3P1Z8B5_TANFO|nr:hypothetical protein [Tannerella forsythia]RRD79612.1 hypothetical protein EII41_00505 [Tannerella forsythia]